MQTPLKEFDVDSFEAHWGRLSEEKKALFLEGITELAPEVAILPVLAGIRSYHFTVRNLARQHLERIQAQVKALLDEPLDSAQYRNGSIACHCICARIYSRIHPDMAFNELSYFFKMLLYFQGRGAYFAFKAVYQKVISVAAMEKIIVSMPESIRLDFVDQYLQTGPAIRLKLGFAFTRILRSITRRKSVIDFYAQLFDRQRDTDPFLNNISADLRSPDAIIQNELASPSPELQVLGLKALSMITSRISPRILIDLLTQSQVRKVRIAVYHVIENSSMGTYPELYDPISLRFCDGDDAEAIHAFKALVVSGKHPVYAILAFVRKTYPSLMPQLFIEISELSKLSFFILQDIALNKDTYFSTNSEANLACVFGMIKKRPERVVRILKKYDNDSKDAFRMGITQFIEKTKQLLSQEKQDIETRFDPVVQQVEKRSQEGKGLLKKFFSTGTQKKLDLLKSGKPGERLHFESDIFFRLDLSGKSFLSKGIYFSRCIFHNCDLSGATFGQTGFNGCIFYDVDMRSAVVEAANFDGAVLINVDAGGAVFKNTSFQGASFFNCNFNAARLIDASLCQCVISKTSFNRANLSFSSFAFSRISAVSFVTSTMNQTDFSSVNARFCRFPSHSKAVARMDEIDFNARAFQLSFSDMPAMEKSIVEEINMLMFCEFIHYGERKFLKQNQLSQLTAFDIFKPRQADLFQIIPCLLHENIPFPGIEDDLPDTPCGIFDYIPDLETQDVLKKYTAESGFVARRSTDPAIEGLFTIGSVGSLAQTSDSDIDYWVCIDGDKIDAAAIGLLQGKLEKMEKMVAEQFELQVTFFLVDIHRARDNDFGDSTIESSGSAQARLLKEEFYRTMIHVAGKIPLWAVLPTAISLHYYNSILKRLGLFSNLLRYMDLGDIHAISSSEYYGASIWQMFKWLKSPFKSVIKMALLEKYIYEYGKAPLLCNQYKDEWMNSGTQLRLAQNDSYYILLENLLKYYSSGKDSRSVNLLITCFFLKLEISKDSQIDNTVFGLRKILLEKCMRKWGWEKEDVFRIGNFKTWQYGDIIRLSTTIEKYMIQKYKTVNSAFEHMFQGKSQISPEDRTVLGRKIFIEFSKQPGKVEKVLLVSRSGRHFQGLHLQYIKGRARAGTWNLVNRQSRASGSQEESLVKAHTIEEIGAWLINNSLYTEETIINLVPNPTYVTFDDVRKLYQTMYDFFRPVLKNPVRFDQLLMKSQLVCLFISLNFYAPRQQSRITEYTAIYMNSWGEMHCRSAYVEKGFLSMEAVRQDILKRIGTDKFPLNTAYYFSKGMAR